jgi:GDPmannose 4,6-dehydratase
LSKVALITGIAGQDGTYLCKFLLNRGYIVHGIKRDSSKITKYSGNFDDLNHQNIYYHYSDLSDPTNLTKIIQEVQPDEIYNLAAQSNVKISFERPEYTSNVNAFGPLRLLEVIRILGLEKKTKFFQASTSEIFGNGKEVPQKENTTFYPSSPYAVSKLYAYWITVNYRESYNIFACNGILFNHESPIRGENFVTRKITTAAARIKEGLQDKLYLGNLNAKRDWGFAGDYVEAMWLMLQQDEPDDYVIATSESHSVREFVQCAFNEVGFDIVWEGEGVSEIGRDGNTGKTLIEVNPDFYRPIDSNLFVGDSSKAREKLGWKPRITFEELVRSMVKNDIDLLQ